MQRLIGLALAAWVAGAAACAAPSSGPNNDAGDAGDAGNAGDARNAGDAGDAGLPARDGATPAPDAPAPPADGPPPGNPAGACDVPAEALPADVSSPRTVVGTGTAASCTSQAFVSAVALGGVITFNCGPAPATITLDATAKVFNDASPDVVIDGNNLVTLSGAGQHRILYMNTCDQAQHWTTSHCQDQDTPRLTVQNLTFADGNSTGETAEGGGGGAIFVRGGRVRILNSRFFRNQCEPTGQDLGGGAVRVLSQSMGLPVYVVHSTFGGAAGLGNHCANGGALSSIGVSYTVLNSLFTDNLAEGHGANSGTPGGGNGGAIYNDGNTYTLSLCGVAMHDNTANEGGGAVFYVSNDSSGHLVIDRSTLAHNPSLGFETQGFPGVFYQGSGPPQVTNSTLTP